MLQPEDVAAACLFAVTLPSRAHAPELTILPTALQAVGKTNVANPPRPAGEVRREIVPASYFPRTLWLVGSGSIRPTMAR